MRGGSLEEALLSAESDGKVIDLSGFFSRPEAQLPRLTPAGEASIQEAGGEICPPPGEDPNHTRRIPPDREPDAAGFHPRISPDARFIVFSSAASDLPGANGQRQIYRFEQSTSSSVAVVILVSRDEAGNAAAADCDQPSISNDGRRVVFQTAAALVADDTDGVSDIYLRDLTSSTPQTVRLTAPRIPGQRGASSGAAISGNGQFVALTSTATDLARGDCDANGVIEESEVDCNGITSDVFRVAINTGGTAGAVELVSVAELQPSLFPQQSNTPMSTIGDALSAVCPNGPMPAPASGCTTVPSGCPSLVSSLGVGRVISEDGTRIVMHGAPCDWGILSPWLCPDPNGDCTTADGTPACPAPIQQVYIRDLLAPGQGFLGTLIVSGIFRMLPDDGCFAANGCCRRASISGDGTRVAFSSAATNLRQTGCETECFEDVWFVDVADLRDPLGAPFCSVPGRVSLVGCDLSLTDGHSFQPMLSTTGDLIGFASHSTKLLSPPSQGQPCPDSNSSRDIFVRTVSTNVLRRFSVDSAGVEANGHSFNPDITGDGNVAVYESEATNLLGPDGDRNGVQDVFQTPSPQGPFIRGDANHDGNINISDSVFISNWLSRGGPPPPCYDAADANDDGFINLTDSIFINRFLFQGGPPPPCPFSCSPTMSCCGRDPTGDGLPCGQVLGGCTEFAADGSCSNCPCPWGRRAVTPDVSNSYAGRIPRRGQVSAPARPPGAVGRRGGPGRP